MDGLEEVKALAANAKELLLPRKYKCLDENMYTAYRKWCTAKKIMKTSEDSILACIYSELECYKSSLLWIKYLMMRSMLKLNEGVDVSKFPNVLHYLKRKTEGHRPKKFFTLMKENVDNFLIRADNEYLLNKVILIFAKPAPRIGFADDNLS